MRATCWTRGLLVLGFGGVLIACSMAALLLSEEAVAETQQTGTPLSNPTISTTQADQAAKITPEQEAALVEVRKILKEAWEVANSTVPPTKLFKSDAPENRLTVLERYKYKLLRDIEVARFRAGDFATATTAKESWELVLGQLRFGYLQEAVRTATDVTFPTDQMLVILKMFSNAGDLAGALKVVEEQTRPGKGFGGGAKWRQKEAELLAYVARRQYWAKAPEALATLRQAMYAVRTNKDNPEFQYWGAAALGCAQAAMGDQAGAVESFRQGIQAATAIRREDHEGERVAALSALGRAAAQSGLQAISREAFQESMRLASQIPGYKARVDAIANLAVIQFRSDDRGGGTKTFQEAVQFAEGLPSNEQRSRALSSVLEREIVVGERAAAQAVLERMRRRAESLPDSKERQVEDLTIRGHEARLETSSEAVERAYAVQNDPEEQASRLAYAANRLIYSKDPVLTPEILQRLSQTSETLLAKPLPDDRKKADDYLGYLAKVQAVASGAAAALQTAGRIGDQRSQRGTYLRLVFLLNQKGDVAGAKQVLASLKVTDEEMLWGSSGTTGGDAFRGLAKAQVMAGDIPGALIWARHESSLYRKAEALLGAALGIMDNQEIYELEHDIPTVKWLVGKGSIDKLAISCGAL